MAKTQKAEISVEEKLRALYDLQFIDSRLDEIRNTRGELPLEVEDLEDEIAGLQKKSDLLQEDFKELDKEIKVRKENIKQSETQIEKYKKQQDNVRNNREFEALAKEIEFQELEIELFEKHIREFKAKSEQKTEVLNGLNEKIASYNEHLAHKKSELDTIVKETELEESQLEEKRKEFAAKVEDRLLNSYEKIRKSLKNGLAVVPVERGASAGSFFAIPPQRQVEIALRKKIITDEYSGRILVDSELAEEERQKMEDLLN
ncbi:MAG: hypothetical protein Q4F57_07685 [Weeksellaceae bacterium]|nr:hypothetical protein [Weeksellaceae bacterium]